MEDADFSIDYILAPVGGGGFLNWELYKDIPKTQLIGVEPEGAPAMLNPLKRVRL